MAENKDEKEGLTTFFKVVVPDMRDMIFKSCEGIESEIDVNLISSGGNLSAPRTARGAQRVNRITFGQGSGSQEGGRTIFDWYQDVCNSSKALDKKTLSIVVTDSEHKTLAEWRILNAWPCKWMAPMMNRDFSSLAVESISFAHEGIERKR